MIKRIFVVIGVIIFLMSCSTQGKVSKPTTDSTTKDNTQPKTITPLETLTPEEKAKIEEIKRLINKLGAENPEDRESAQEKLIKIGKIALPYIRKATKHRDAEISERAKFIDKELTLRMKKDALKLTISTDKDIYEIGKDEHITITCELTNTSDESIVIFTDKITLEDISIIEGFKLSTDTGNLLKRSMARSSVSRLIGPPDPDYIRPATEDMFRILERDNIVISDKRTFNLSDCNMGKFEIKASCSFKKINLENRPFTNLYFATQKAKELWDETFEFNIEATPITIEIVKKKNK